MLSRTMCKGTETCRLGWVQGSVSNGVLLKRKDQDRGVGEPGHGSFKYHVGELLGLYPLGCVYMWGH